MIGLQSGPERTLSTNAFSAGQFVETLRLSNGDVVAAWVNQDGTVYQQRFGPDGASIGSAQVVHPQTIRQSFAGLQMTDLADGGYVIATTGADASNGSDFIDVFNADGSLRTSVHPLTAGGHISGISAWGSGFQLSFSGEPSPHVRRYDASGAQTADLNAPIRATQLVDAQHITTFAANQTQGFIIRSDGSTGPIFPLSSRTITDSTINLRPDGAIVAITIETPPSAGDPAGTTLRGQRWTIDGTKTGAEFLIAENGGGDQVTPEVLGLTGGRFFVFWASNHTGDYDVRGRLFDGAGDPLGSEFLVNSGAQAGDQMQPEASLLSDGTALVVFRDLAGKALKAQVIDPLFAAGSGPILLTDGGDVPFGTNQAEAFAGLGGDDSIYALGGDDLLFGDQVSELSNPGDGADQLSAGAGNDRIYGGGGNDSLYGGDGDDFLHGGAGADSLQGGAGYDTVYYDVAAPAGQPLVVDVLNPNLSTGEAFGDLFGSIEAYVGSSGIDVFRGTDANESFRGGDGDDTLYGRGGVDRFDGGDGVDTVWYEAAAPAGDFMIVDLLQQNRNTGEAAGDTYVSIERVVGTNGVDSIWGTNGDDVFAARDGDDALVGRGGADLLDGGAGIDTAWYETAAPAGQFTLIDLLAPETNTGEAAGDRYVSIERVVGTLGSDWIRGTQGDDILAGRDSGDVLEGRDGNDLLDGGGGGDRIAGGAGADRLVGGGDKDAFVWFAPSEGGDQVFDFVSGQDRLEFVGSAFGMSTGALGAGAFVKGAGATATGSGPQFAFDTATNTLWFDDDGAGAHAAVHIATFVTGTVNAGDILIV